MAETPGGTAATPFDLNPGDEIARTELHRRFGGSGRGGITASTSTPNVFVFSEPRLGRPHGYYDGWIGGFFHYTGMGPHGDQRFAAGNRRIRDHRAEGNALRLFRGARGTVTYLGEFETDPVAAYYYTDAPEGGTNELRQVIVFRLRPIGSVLRDAIDRFEPPPGMSDAEARAATTGRPHSPTTETIPVEATPTETMVVNPDRKPDTAVRREQRLVLEYVAYMQAQGSTVTRHRILPSGESRPTFTDAYDETRGNLIEAKGTVTREAIRMAIGQLADYGRFVPNEARPAVLLPRRPRVDLEALLQSQGIAALWETEDGFADNAGGQFT